MLDNLKQIMEKIRGCSPSFLGDIAVVEKFGDEIARRGVVSVFLIEGQPQADKRYARSLTIDGCTKRKSYAVLQISPIDSPEKAVRASIVHTCKRGKGNG